jgi:hypothetical protein
MRNGRNARTARGKLHEFVALVSGQEVIHDEHRR